VNGFTPPPLGCALAGEFAYPLFPLFGAFPPKGVAWLVLIGEAKLEHEMQIR
jgi:hypothetical protein